MILNKKQQEIEELAKKVGETQDIKDIRQQFCGFKAGITFAKEEILKEIEKFLLQQDSLIYNFLAQRLSEDEFCDLRNQSIKELKEKIK